MQVRKASSAGYVHGKVEHDLDERIMEAAVGRLSEVYSAKRRKVFIRSDIEVPRAVCGGEGLTYWFSLSKVDPNYTKLFGRKRRTPGRRPIRNDLFYCEMEPMSSAVMDMLYGLPDNNGMSLSTLIHVDLRLKYPRMYDDSLERAGTPKRMISRVNGQLDEEVMNGVLLRRGPTNVSPAEMYMPAEEKALRVLDYAGKCKP